MRKTFSSSFAGFLGSLNIVGACPPVFSCCSVTDVLSVTQVDQTGDVIEFYNAVFIPATKGFLLQLGNGTTNLLPLPTLTMPGTPLHGRAGSNPYSLATPAPPDRATINKCLSPAGKVFVSPMRQPGQQVILVPVLTPLVLRLCASPITLFYHASRLISLLSRPYYGSDLQQAKLPYRVGRHALYCVIIARQTGRPGHAPRLYARAVHFEWYLVAHTSEDLALIGL